MRILVTGAAGQLGSDISRELKRRLNQEILSTSNKARNTNEKDSPTPSVHHFIHALKKDELDISDPSQVSKIFSEINPDIVYNCAAFTDVDGCESRPDKAFLINGEAPGLMAKACKKYGAQLVHFSTDYVFNGHQQTPYTEEDPTEPLNVYGESKLMGEELIRAADNPHLIIRTSWLYGRTGKNFIKTILRLAEESSRTLQPLNIVNDQTGSPTHTADLALKTIELASAGLNGTFNVTNDGQCTWFEFAKEILMLKGLNNIEIQPITTSELARPAIRPFYSVLSNQKLIDNGFIPLREWRSSLDEYLKFFK